MAFITPDERPFATALSRLGFANPFLPERIEQERAALGDDFVPAGEVWSVHADRAVQNPNVARLGERAAALAGRLRERLAGGASPSAADRQLYEDVVLYLLYSRYETDFLHLIVHPAPADGGRRVAFWEKFQADCGHFLGPSSVDAAHLFACLFQVRRAFHHIFWGIIGGSLSMARLRAAVWQSIFTRDMRRYRRTLYGQMADITTLIVGPSGTGKEVVARAIGLSRYIPFDAKAQRFVAHFADLFHPLNLSALSPTLIESELFGHRRGAFTGALQDRAGWLETCEPLGTVFLDEVGDVDASIQVKLLRVLQTRHFQRLGDTKTLVFHDNNMAATNRDLAHEIAAGRFREDFYYRLCSDLITTPPLAEQLRESAEELPNLLRFIARRVVGEEEARAVADETLAWIERHLGRAYPWPGNVRELEQCVRNVLIRGEYRPAITRSRNGVEALAAAVSAGTLTADELLGRYCTLVYAQTGSYQETARRLGIDRRTVKAKVDPELLRAYGGHGGS